MIPVLMLQWMKEKRNPAIILCFIVLSVGATLLFAGNMGSKVKIDVFHLEEITEADARQWIKTMNASDNFAFVLQDERTARSKVREGRRDLAIMLLQDEYKMVAAIEGPNVQLVKQHLDSIFNKELKLRHTAAQLEDESMFRQDVESYLENPPASISASDINGEELNNYDMGLQLMFGFSLFLVMFTVGFKLNAITKDKVTGVWDRLILSPLKKTAIYLGHLTYSFIIGLIQIVVVFLIFHYGFGFDLGDQPGTLFLVVVIYVLTIVAMSILLVGLLRTPEQFASIFPSIIPIMPLLSGVYMPPGTISNPILLGISELFPIKHAMGAMLDISMYDAALSDVWLPLSKLIFIGVLCMGVGINLMERRHQ